ncbi:probable calcium-binding protein CML15 [Andrographis paniculata]|uniref:probable calcium-binding protein CML15 n=1 Tax=Andrographis paniculata TaxID=175694 RepID=UPI0021E8F142|nr:probable calcium-binding protein CML15 [Andrographis paniculata]
MATICSDELKQLKEIFNRFDMDNDGSLTQLELAALLRSLGLRPTGDQITTMLANMDANGNGAIEFDELVEVLLPDMDQQFLVDQDRLMQVFQSFDRDGNGYITLVELAAKMAQMKQPLTYNELTELMQEADTNGDGVISFSEFANILARSAVDYLTLPAPS